MFKPSRWPRLIISLSPALALLLLPWIASANAESTCYNDPFRAIALQTPKSDGPPICCLKPSPSLEPVEDNLLLSFEEWKARQQQHGSENVSVSSLGNASGTTNETIDAENVTAITPPPDDQQSQALTQNQDFPLQSSPQLRIPLVDRFNYASLDCSARVHLAHKSAKHISNILSSKKDKYMLSPCKTNGEKQFVVIELCDDIRIDTVQLANFEFFSGVFKDFTVSVAKTYSMKEEDWTTAGTYRAKNIRGVQSFHPPTSLRDFYRYLRIDFHSHYGSEYYCPVSLVRVFGLTHLEEWKLEVWEAESKAKMEAQLKQKTVTPAEIPSASNNTTSSILANASQIIQEKTSVPSAPIKDTDSEAAMPSPISTTNHPVSNAEVYSASNFPSQPSEVPHSETSHSIAPTSSPTIATSVSYPLPPTTAHIPTNSSPSVAPSESPNTTDATTIMTDNITHLTAATTILPATNNTSLSRPGSPHPSSSSSSSSIVLIPTPLVQSPLPIPVSGGESVYRMIMNRLMAVETNHTLYEKYMAQQQLIVREALKRLGEDVGRLEGLGRAQQQAHDRTVVEWEKQRKQWQMEHAYLLQRIEYLSDEIVMEKRLGVAQLCLLLAVLVFMGLTRGSGGPIVEYRPRHWKSALGSLSRDWVGSHRKEENEIRKKTVKYDGNENTSTIPTATTDSIPSPRYPPSPIDLNTYPPEHNTNVSQVRSNTSTRTPKSKQKSRSQTPSSTSRRTILVGTPPRLELRSSTGGAHGTPSKSHMQAIARSNYVSAHSASTVLASTYHHHNHHRRPVIMRANSSQAIIPLVGSASADAASFNKLWGSEDGLKSTRKWARTAHLHEVRKEKQVRKEEHEDVFGDVGGKESSKIGEEAEKMVILKSEEAERDADGWESASDADIEGVCDTCIQGI